MTRSTAASGLGGELTLPRVAAGLRIVRVEPEHCRRRARDNRHSLKPRLLHTRHPTPVRTIGGERHGPPLRFQLLLKLFSDDRVRIPRQDAPATLRSQSDGLGQTLLFHLQHVGTLVGPLYG